MGRLKDRIRRLERSKPPVPRERPEHEHEREQLRAELRRDAEHANSCSSRDGFGPLFRITEDGDVVCESDGRPVVRRGQISGEMFYRLHIYERQYEGLVDGLIHDEEQEAFLTPDTGEIAVCRDFVHIGRLFKWLGP